MRIEQGLIGYVALLWALPTPQKFQSLDQLWNYCPIPLANMSLMDCHFM